ncbi:Sorting nexin 2A-like protein [Drosera capensis]
MMGSETEVSEAATESPILDDPLNSKSYVSYRSAMSTLSESHYHHPLFSSASNRLSTSPAIRDPLLPPSLDDDEDDRVTPSSHHGNNNNNIDDALRAVDSDFDRLDAIISPLDENSNGGDANEDDSPTFSSGSLGNYSRSESSSSRSEYLKISVWDPRKEQEPSNSIVEGSNTFVTYLITTKTNMWGFGGSEFSVRRRFRDVVTLADRLAESYRGYFIPPRPDKSVVEGQVMHKQEFVELRRLDLEKYLMRLASHPVIRKSNELRVFLQVPGKLPLARTIDVASRVLDGAMKLPKQLTGDAEAVQGVKSGMDLLKKFKELRQSLTNDLGSSRPPVIEEDKEFLERKEKLQNFEQHLIDASKQAEILIKAQQDIGRTMGELGLSLVKLTKFENEKASVDAQRIHAAVAKNAATTTIKASRVYKELNAKTVKDLDTLHDYFGSVLAARNAFTDRSSALFTVQTLFSELSSLQSRIARLEAASSRVFGVDTARINRIEGLKETMRHTEDAKNEAMKDYERIKENNRSEMVRLDREQRTDLLNMLKGFVNDQANCAEKLSDAMNTEKLNLVSKNRRSLEYKVIVYAPLEVE